MNPTTLFAFLGGLLALAFVANRLYRMTRVPDVIALMVVGVILGPVLGWVQASHFESVTRIFGTLALILILFEGGLELNLRHTLRHFPGGVLLAVVGYYVSMALVTLVAWQGYHFPLRPALLIGAVFGCVSGSIALPVLQQIRTTTPVRVTLLVEASLGDVLGVLTVSVLLSVAGTGGAMLTGFLAGTLLKVFGCILGSIIAAVVWTRVLRSLAEQRFWQVMTLSIVLLLYAGWQAASQAGLLAVFAFGLTLANLRHAEAWGVAEIAGAGPGEPQHHAEILSFHSELAFLVRSFFFILLGVILNISGLQGYALLTAGIFVALIVARWFAVKASSWAWGEKDTSEKHLAMLLFPRGLITAVLAIEVIQARGSAFSFLASLAFAIIFLTNLLVVIASVRAGSIPAEAPAVPLPDY